MWVFLTEEGLAQTYADNHTHLRQAPIWSQHAKDAPERDARTAKVSEVVVVCAVAGEPVSADNSLLTR